MKKLFIIVAALFVAVSFSACSDDDAPEINSKLIVGKWQYVRSAGYYMENGVKEKYDDDFTSDNVIIIYKADGTAVNIQNGDEHPFIIKSKAIFIAIKRPILIGYHRRY